MKSKLANIRWFTNISIPDYRSLVLTKSYNKQDYPVFDNYPAINVGRTVHIPVDYLDIMGVPISYMDYYDPDLFEIQGYVDRPFLSGKVMYKRILIKRK